MDWIEFLRDMSPLLDVLLSIAGLLTASLLSVMAIVLTCAANKIAAANLRVAKRQAAIAEIQLQPIFRFELERVTGEDGPHERLRIFNDGAPIEALFIKQAVFLEADLTDSERSGRRAVPIYYFGNREYTGQRAELLATMSTLWSPFIFGTQFRNASLEVEALVGALRGSRRDIYAHLRIFIILSYADMSGIDRTVTYEVNPEWTLHSPALPRVLRGEEAANTLQEYFYLHSTGPENLATLTREEVMERWERYPSTEALGRAVSPDSTGAVESDPNDSSQ